MIHLLMTAAYDHQLAALCEEHGVAGCVTVLATDPTWKVSDLGVDLSAVYSSLEGKKSISALCETPAMSLREMAVVAALPSADPDADPLSVHGESRSIIWKNVKIHREKYVKIVKCPDIAKLTGVIQATRAAWGEKGLRLNHQHRLTVISADLCGEPENPWIPGQNLPKVQKEICTAKIATMKDLRTLRGADDHTFFLFFDGKIPAARKDMEDALTTVESTKKMDIWIIFQATAAAATDKKTLGEDSNREIGQMVLPTNKQRISCKPRQDTGLLSKYVQPQPASQSQA